MKKRFLAPTCALVALLVGASHPVRAQIAESHYDRMVRISHAYQVNLDVTYRTVNNWDAKLDIIRPRQSSAPTPTVLYFHGGGWTQGSKDAGLTAALPYLEMGWAVVNVAYRV